MAHIIYNDNAEWPIGLKQRLEELETAGFFYSAECLLHKVSRSKWEKLKILREKDSLLLRHNIQSKNMARIAFPKYNDFRKRLKTFAEWPIGLNQQPEELADAGFWYTRISDSVICFYCELALNNWAPDDDPWTEHALWNPYCHFVKMKKPELISSLDIPEPAGPALVGPTGLVGPGPVEPGPVGPGPVDLGPVVPGPVEPGPVGTPMGPGPVGTPVGPTGFIIEQERGFVRLAGPVASVPASTPIRPSAKINKAIKEDDHFKEQQNLAKKTEIADDKIQSDSVCQICYERKRNVILLPCSHSKTCSECCSRIDHCPFCRTRISDTLFFYL